MDIEEDWEYDHADELDYYQDISFEREYMEILEDNLSLFRSEY